MKEVSGGRFCSSCQHQVIDFTTMNDRQLVEYLKQAKGWTCGRFLPGQLDREIVIPRKPLPWMKYFVTIALPAFLVSLKAAGQPRMLGKVVITETKTVTCTQEKPVKEMDSTISGIVVDNNGLPVVGATIMIKGKNIGAAARADGRFTIVAGTDEAVLQVSAVGYQVKELPAVKGENLIVLEPAVMGEVVITGMVIPVKRKEVPLIKKITQPSFTGFSVYPNPSKGSDRIHVSINKKPAGHYRIEIRNAAGAIVQTEEIQTLNGRMDIQLNALAAGMYSVTLVNKDTKKDLTEKILIQ